MPGEDSIHLRLTVPSRELLDAFREANGLSQQAAAHLALTVGLRALATVSRTDPEYLREIIGGRP